MTVVRCMMYYGLTETSMLMTVITIAVEPVLTQCGFNHLKVCLKPVEVNHRP